MTVKDTAIARLFEKPEAIQWVRYFKGRMDDVSDVDISLAYDGTHCRGILHYVDSHTRFTLDGSLDITEFKLQERDGGKQASGYLSGAIQDGRLEADWTNLDNTLGSRLEATERLPGQVGSAHCSDNKWISRYITRWNNGRVDAVLIRANNGALHGYLWVEADAKTYPLEGDIFDDGNYALQALLPNGQVAAHLQGTLKDPASTECNWTGSGEKRVFKLAQKETLPVGCYEWADYVSSYDALYPRTRNPECNKWLDRQVTLWMGRCKADVAAKKPQATPAARNSLRASAWTDVVCWTETIFAGYLTFTDSWNPQAQGVAFNLNLGTGKEITYADLFNKSFNAEKWLAEYARKESPKLPKFASDPAFREWVTAEGFPLFALRRDGLELSTRFHPIYGQQHLLIPYQVIKPYMRKDNPVAEFVK